MMHGERDKVPSLRKKKPEVFWWLPNRGSGASARMKVEADMQVRSRSGMLMQAQFRSAEKAVDSDEHEHVQDCTVAHSNIRLVLTQMQEACEQIILVTCNHG